MRDPERGTQPDDFAFKENGLGQHFHCMLPEIQNLPLLKIIF